LYFWYNMKGLIPKENLLYPPYSRSRLVPMILLWCQGSLCIPTLLPFA
jgi:hypothetical protein